MLGRSTAFCRQTIWSQWLHHVSAEKEDFNGEEAAWFRQFLSPGAPTLKARYQILQSVLDTKVINLVDAAVPEKT